jgi:hypothetical protein
MVEERSSVRRLGGYRVSDASDECRGFAPRPTGAFGPSTPTRGKQILRANGQLARNT